MNTVFIYILYFFFYSAAGWLGESIYCSIGERRLINRGFLTGPMCPIYGTGTLVLTVCLYNPFRDKLVLVFFAGLVLCDIVEYITSYLMEKLFHARWWDYSNEFLNIKGRICLKHSLYWGVASVAFVWLIHPYVEKLFQRLPENLIMPFAAVILSVFLIDVINSVRKALDIRKIQLKLQQLVESVGQMPSNVVTAVEEMAVEFKLDLAKTSDRLSDKRHDAAVKLLDFLSAVEHRLMSIKKGEKLNRKNRLITNNPYLRESLSASVERMKETLEQFKQSVLEQTQQFKK